VQYGATEVKPRALLRLHRHPRQRSRAGKGIAAAPVDPAQPDMRVDQRINAPTPFFRLAIDKKTIGRGQAGRYGHICCIRPN